MATDFEKGVWRCCRKIPKGSVSTYKLIAQAVGKPKSYRAVGNALNKNPKPGQTPCHRVIFSNGYIGGYAGSIKEKEKLLKKEGINIEKEKVIFFKKKLFERF